MLTAEEIEIKVTADVVGVLQEFKKMLPKIKQETNKIQKELNNKEFSTKIKDIDTKKITQQISKASKEINDAVEELSPTFLKQLKDMSPTIKGVSNEYKRLTKTVKASDAEISKTSSTNVSPITKKEAYAPYITAGERLKQLPQSTNNAKAEDISPSPSSLSLWDILKDKIKQIKPVIEEIKADWKSTDGVLGGLRQKIQSLSEKLKSVASRIMQIATAPIRNLTSRFIGLNKSVGNVQKGLKSGIGQILKYAGALLSIRGIYGALRSASQAWLSSENKEAQQASANISYLSYAWGSLFAPVIQFVTNLVYQLTKAIQSLVYAFSGVNIFAKATASSMKSASKSAKDTNKSLSGVHNEINNVSDNKNSGGGAATPNMDLTSVNPANDFMNAIQNGEWYKAGQLVAQKINEAMSNIDWTSIQKTSKQIAENIALFLNGFVAELDWFQLGNTIAQGLNTALYFVQTFLHTFDFKAYGEAIQTGLMGFIKNFDWLALGDTISQYIIDVYNFLAGFIEKLDWKIIMDAILNFIAGINWSGISTSFFYFLGTAMGKLVDLGMVIGDYIGKAVDKAKEYFQDKIEECGGNVVLGILKGIADAVLGIGKWIVDNVFKPFIEGFKSAFEIHSPSVVMAELGKLIIEGLFNGILSLVEKITEIWEKMKEIAIGVWTKAKEKVIEIVTNLKENAVNKITETKEKIIEKFNNVKSDVISIWENIKTRIGEKITNLKSNISNVLNNIKSTWSNIWNGMKNTVSDIWNGIWNIIKGVINRILGGIENFANSIVTGVNAVLSTLSGISSAIGGIFGVDISIPQLNRISLPRLKTGNVAYNETIGIFGEYANARSNPEITAPQNVLKETFEEVLANNDEKVINLKLQVNVGNKKIGSILLEDLRKMKRASGQDIEALIGG